MPSSLPASRPCCWDALSTVTVKAEPLWFRKTLCNSCPKGARFSFPGWISAENSTSHLGPVFPCGSCLETGESLVGMFLQLQAGEFLEPGNWEAEATPPHCKLRRKIPSILVTGRKRHRPFLPISPCFPPSSAARAQFKPRPTPLSAVRPPAACRTSRPHLYPGAASSPLTPWARGGAWPDRRSLRAGSVCTLDPACALGCVLSWARRSRHSRLRVVLRPGSRLWFQEDGLAVSLSG
ncbi:uncharacterized protein LOC129558775 [Moschus berezovskii]|uniref:uncharacterized protein LOC129558775 n=1 Tax=Moschus berezovskii TaxID=68408 RepID=UPI002443F016|nr:uncharacterized protein LOC129558775 [Moschus berezovskii]